MTTKQNCRGWLIITDHTVDCVKCSLGQFTLQEGINVTDPAYLAQLDKDKLAQILRSDSDVKMPMLDERLEVLKEAGDVLVNVSLRSGQKT